MKEDFETVVQALASFLGIHDEANVRAAVENSSLKFMKANQDKFSTGKIGLNKLTFIRTGSADEALKVLSDDVKAVIQNRWEKDVTGVTGYKTYEELRVGSEKKDLFKATFYPRHWFLKTPFLKYPTINLVIFLSWYFLL